MLYEFGNCTVDAGKRLLTRDRKPVPLAPKTFDLLLFLIESGGRALSKAELMQALWPDCFVEEANLSFQVSTLRKALGEQGAAWIETVPKHGYRFAGTVGQKETRVEARPGWVKWAAAAGLAAAAAFGFVLMHNGPAQQGAAAPSVTPLTAYPGMQIQPSLSPDGSHVAFSWNGPNEDNFDIYVKLVGPGEPVRLTSHPAREIAPAFSPDGRQIAFLRFSSAEQASIILIPALGGGVERKVTEIELSKVRSLAGLAWTADGKHLVFGGADHEGNGEGGLHVVSIEGSETRRITTPPAGLYDSMPAFSPDGRSLIFVRKPAPGFGDLYLQPLKNGLEPDGHSIAMTTDQIPVLAAAWLSNRRIAYSVGLAQVVRRLRFFDVASGKWQAAGFGEGASGLSASGNGTFVYARESQDANLWQFDMLDGQARPQRIAPSRYQNWTPAISHDGRRIAFASTRSGLEEIWVAGADGSHPFQLTRIGSGHVANPRWSPDDRALVFNAWTPRSDLYSVDVNDGSVNRLTDDPADEGEPSWSRDGKWVYFGGNRTGRLEVYRIPAVGGPMIQLTRNGGLHAEESVDGKWLYYSLKPGSPASLWRVPRGGGEGTPILEDLSYSTNFMPVEKGIFFIAGSGGSDARAAIEFFDFATAKRSVVRSLERPFTYGIALSPDQRSLVHGLMDNASSNLMLVENYR